MGAEARQAGRVQPVRAHRRARGLQHPRGRSGADAERPLRHHPRRRHGAPARRGAAAGRRPGAPAQPRRVRPRARTRRPGLRDPAAARRRVAAERAPVALRGHPLRAPGRRPVHHRRLRRVPGPLRRGQLHREGHLRRRGVRARDARPLPREHPAVARPDRGELRARRSRHRRDRVRRLPDPLSHLHPPQAPLDPGRLAAAPLAHRHGAGPGRPRAEPAVVPVALEDPRQPAAQHHRDRAARVPGGGLDAAPGLAAALDPAGARGTGGAVAGVAPARGAPPAARQVVARLLRRGGPRRGHQRPPDRPGHRVPAAPGVASRRTPSCARSGAWRSRTGISSSGGRRPRSSAA